jgi:chromosome segregation ATPase
VTVLIVLLGIALAASLAFNFGLFGQTPTSSTRPSPASAEAAPSSQTRGDEGTPRANRSDGELEKKRKELDELRKSHADLKDELKGAKKKLHDAKTEGKTGDDLMKARAEVERQASIQLDNTRAELATALSEVARLRADADLKGKKRIERPAAPTEMPEEKAEKPQEVVTRVIRELSDVEKERIARLEAQSSTDRKKAIELDRDLKSLKAKLERHHRESKHVFSEGTLARDKFRAVETRLNRTLLENDLLRRAVADLEKKTGLHAEHAQPTAEEFAESDRKMTRLYADEDKANAVALEKLMAAPAASEDDPASPAAHESSEAVSPGAADSAPLAAASSAPLS